MVPKIDELLKKEKKVNVKRLRNEEARKQREEEEERIRLENIKAFFALLNIEIENAKNRNIPVCPVCKKTLIKHSTYIDKKRGEIIHKYCGGVIEENILTSHRGILKGVSK